MTRKRKESNEDDSEMEIDNDEGKVEMHDGDDDYDDDDTDSSEEITSSADEQSHKEGHGTTSEPVDNPFLDSFYDLSSEDHLERSKAAQIMLNHCLLGPTANAQDAAYAFRRLLNGVCSGRAAARQGNASALASFLKIAFHLGKMEDIKEVREGDLQTSSLLDYVRTRLLSVTDPSQVTGKKKGSEERDYQFGRLFGILAIVRSGILTSENLDYSEITDVASGLASDLVALFWLKRWMREPAAHGITTLLKVFYDNRNRDNDKVARDVLDQVLIPKLLTLNASDETPVTTDHNSLFQAYCAEQIGVALFIQSQAYSAHKSFPFPLDEPVASKVSIPMMAQAISETSTVVQPRTHFLWDSMWHFLTEPAGSSTNKGSEKRQLRVNCQIGMGKAAEVLESIIQHVIIKKLLRIEADTTGSATGKATHERRALALSLVKVLLGVPYVSSISGRTEILIPDDILESLVLTPQLIRSLFLDVICAGNEKKKTTHMLKPMSLDVLSEITVAVETHVKESNDMSRRLAVVKALLNCEIRFDARTKTTTVSDLLGFNEKIKPESLKAFIGLWVQYTEFLQTSLLNACSEINEGNPSALATGYLELSYGAVKAILRLETSNHDDGDKLAEFKKSLTEKMLRFYLTLAFFDCTAVERIANKSGKKGKSKKAKVESTNDMLDVALQVKGMQTQSNKGIPHSGRALISARFYSLVSEFCGYSTHASQKESDGKSEKDSTILSVLNNLTVSWDHLEQLKAVRYCEKSNEGSMDDDNDDDKDPRKKLSTILDLVKKANGVVAASPSDAKKIAMKRCSTGIAVLCVSVYLHRLSVGHGDEEDEDPDVDDDGDEAEICNALEGLVDVASAFSGESDEIVNPLLGLAEICANILSSPLGSGNMGRAASPRLIREAAKFAWLGALRMSACKSTKESTLLDSNVIAVLLESIGASQSHESGEPQDGSDDDDDMDDSEESDNSSEEDVFSKAANTLNDDEEDEESAPKAARNKKTDDDDADDQSDIEIDAENLRSILQEDSDADIDENVLEHHEGADAALAKLIKLRQESRKAGQQARENLEIAQQLRCTMLLELLLGRSDGWQSLFRVDVLSECLIPLLHQRKKMEKILEKSIESGNKGGHGDKQALLLKIDSLMKEKIGKMKPASFPFGSHLATERSVDLTREVLTEAKQACSKEHAACCSSCLIFVLRSTVCVDGDFALADSYKDAIEEWSTKRSSKIPADLFDDLILHVPIVSQIVLARALIDASRNARSSFLKAEAYRLLTPLLSVKHGSEESDLAQAAAKRMSDIHASFLLSVESTLKDEDMRKAKRIRIVLKALEKFVAGLTHPIASSELSSFESTTSLLESLQQSESQGVKAICSKLLGDMEKKSEEWKVLEVEESKEEESEPKDVDGSTSKKKKKKKKKKR